MAMIDETSADEINLKDNGLVNLSTGDSITSISKADCCNEANPHPLYVVKGTRNGQEYEMMFGILRGVPVA